MSRISIEVIIAAVKRCVSGESSYTEEMKLLGVPKQTLQDWIRKYETFGIEGFLPSGNEKYSKRTK